MRSLSIPAIALLFVGCQFSASCGGKKLDMKKAEEFVSTALEGEIKQKPTAVSCPASVKIAKDTTFDCQVTFGTAVANVSIQQNDEAGNVTIKLVTGILIAVKLEKQISDEIGKKLNIHVTANCGDRVRASKAGDTFTCDAQDAKGVGGKIAVTVKDNLGNVNWQIVNADGSPVPPPTAPAPSDTPPAPSDEAPPAPTPPAAEAPPAPTGETPPAPTP